MTPRGLIKLTAVANNLEAMRDWKRVAEEAERNGYGALVCKHFPSGAAGWRTIDKARRALLADIAAARAGLATLRPNGRRSNTDE